MLHRKALHAFADVKEDSADAAGPCDIGVELTACTLPFLALQPPCSLLKCGEPFVVADYHDGGV